MDFKTFRTEIGRGPYSESEIPNTISIGQFRVPGKNFDLHKTVFQAIGSKTLDKILKKGYSLDSHRVWLAADITSDRFVQFKRLEQKMRNQKLVVFKRGAHQNKK